jgi:hypothetical protein
MPRDALAHDLVTWPEWPLRYNWIPSSTRDAAPYLYYLYYRSPAPFDPYDVYDYVVPAIPRRQARRSLFAAVEQHASSRSITWCITARSGITCRTGTAYHRAPSRIGKIAAVDCASRIGMFAGGTMAKDGRVIVGDLMEDDRDSVAARATVAAALARSFSRARDRRHRAASVDDDVRRRITFYDRASRLSTDAARARTVKNTCSRARR